jgi:hypothetical protein
MEALMIDWLGAHYVASPAAPISAAELTAWRRWIAAEFSRIPHPIRTVGQDVTLPECARLLAHTGRLYISSISLSHPLLSAAENLRFRAVHDWHHLTIGADSTFAGELAAYRRSAESAPTCIHWVLFSEIVLQAAARLYTGEFQPQKLVR